MNAFLYSIFISIYQLAAQILALFQSKAKLLVAGQENLLREIELALKNEKREKIWFHCASLGEFEQGRPVMEGLRKARPELKIFLTFFSPSGYETRKNYTGADYVFYLPFDTKKNATKFLEIVKPQMAIFIKYEFWYNYLKTLHKNSIPTILISAIFQERHPFFKWYGGLQRQMLGWINHFFVQNEASIKLLNSIDIQEVTISGDTRIDRAVTIVEEKKEQTLAQEFKKDSILIVAGSTWAEDELLLKKSLELLKEKDVKLLIAPHEIEEEHITNLFRLFHDFKPCLWTDGTIKENSKVLIVNTMGELAYLYRYADFVWIGGGFNKTGIHNSIEAAAYHKALCWGPRYDRYQEAIDLIESGASKSFSTAIQFVHQLEKWQSDATSLKNAEQASQVYIKKHLGATEKIMWYILQQKRI